MKIVYDINLDLINVSIMETKLNLCCGDKNLIRFNITILENGNKYDISQMAKADIIFNKSNGKVVQGTLNLQNDIYIYDFLGNELDCPGPIIVDVKLYSDMEGSGRVSTKRFKINAVKDNFELDAEESKTVISEIDRIRDDYNAWYAEVQGILNEEAAVNLQNQITNNKEKLDTHTEQIEDLDTRVSNTIESMDSGVYVGDDIPEETTTFETPLDADTLGGQKPTYYAKQSDLEEVGNKIISETITVQGTGTNYIKLDYKEGYVLHAAVETVTGAYVIAIRRIPSESKWAIQTQEATNTSSTYSFRLLWVK